MNRKGYYCSSGHLPRDSGAESSSLILVSVVIAEKALIAQIRRLAKSNNPAVVAGIGDDCAVLRLAPEGKGDESLVTTDFSLEGIHFRREWHSPESIGHRCLTRGLSDIAAMGGKPVAAFLSLALPRDLTSSWVTRFTRGLISLAKRYGVTLAGGDIAESPDGILADIIVVGTVPKGKALLRSRATCRRSHLRERGTRRLGGCRSGKCLRSPSGS